MDTLFGVLVGGLITWLASWHYYQKAGRELRDEAAALRHRVALVGSVAGVVLHALMDAGMVEFERHADGRIKYDPETGLPAAVQTDELTHNFGMGAGGPEDGPESPPGGPGRRSRPV